MRQLELVRPEAGGAKGRVGAGATPGYSLTKSGQSLFRAAILLMVEMVLALPLLGQFASSQLKSFCLTSELGMEPRSALIQGSDGSYYGTTLRGGGSLTGTIFKLRQDGGVYQVIHRFTATEPADGASPYGGLMEGSDRMLYGTTFEGGVTNQGTVYRLNKDGGGFAVLHRFGGGATDGANAYAGLAEGRDGALYGTTFVGGSANQGVVFVLNRDGTNYRVLKHFTGAGGDGSQPAARLLGTQDGVLFGTTYFGGSGDGGAVFKLNKDGTGFGVLHSFSGTGGDGAFPFAGLSEGADGQLYGTTTAGGTSDLGTVFKLKKDGSGYSVLHRFTTDSESGTQPFGGVLQGRNGFLYGTTAFRGTNENGSVFRLDTGGAGYAVLRRFTGTGGDGATPYAGLTQGADGLLYGTTVSGGAAAEGTIFKLSQDGGGYGVVHSFVGPGGEAASPYAAIIEGSDGAFYGTTYLGGRANLGAVYRLNHDGSGYSVLYSFSGKDGSSPYSALLETLDGALYGTTVRGGSSDRGTVFRLNKNGAGQVVLHSFTGSEGDGAYPYAALIEGVDGQLYGTTAGDLNIGSYGSVYKLKKDGTGYSVLHAFAMDGGGVQPFGGLVQGGNGILYGTTAYKDSTALGTVFQIGANGVGFRVLHTFANTSDDGAFPFAGLLKGTDGTLYGTTFSGGIANHGTVFKLNQDGSGYSVLRRFTGGASDGSKPASNASLVEGSDGCLYGLTFSGGSANLGTVFNLKRDGSGYGILLNFTGVDGDGASPSSGLARSRAGAFYGTTLNGGGGCGTLFRIAPAASFSITASTGLGVSGPAGFRFTVQYTDNLGSPAQWRDLPSITLPNTQLPLTDPSSGSAQQRFYRAILNP